MVCLTLSPGLCVNAPPKAGPALLRSLHRGTADALKPVRAPTVEQPMTREIRACRSPDSLTCSPESGTGARGSGGTWAPVTLLTARTRTSA